MGCVVAVPYHTALAAAAGAALRHHNPCLLVSVHNTDKIGCNLAGAQRAPLRDIQRAPAVAAAAATVVPAAAAAPTPRSILTGEQATPLQLLVMNVFSTAAQAPASSALASPCLYVAVQVRCRTRMVLASPVQGKMQALWQLQQLGERGQHEAQVSLVALACTSRSRATGNYALCEMPCCDGMWMDSSAFAAY